MNVHSDFLSLPSRFLRSLRPSRIRVEQVTTPFNTALQELEERKKNPELRKKVEEYLQSDIPAHFSKDPILYMARHVATPNFETLRFLHVMGSSGLECVIGQDPKDMFVPQNQLKKSLGKLPISLGVSKKHDTYHELYQHVSIIDFNTSNGKSFSSIKTSWGEDLVSFHNNLFKRFTSVPVSIVDDSEWIDRQNRGSLFEHYKRFLALFVTHGILVEDYLLVDKEEDRFIREILFPATRFVEKKFGVRPLLVQLNPTTIESSKFWMSYPQEVLEAIPIINNI